MYIAKKRVQKYFFKILSFFTISKIFIIFSLAILFYIKNKICLLLIL